MIARFNTRELFSMGLPFPRDSRLIRVHGYKRLVSNPEPELVWWMSEG
jgi:hypothetical protein